jgi:hypothetical protein
VKVEADRSREEEGKDPYVDDVGRGAVPVPVLVLDAVVPAMVEVLVEVPLAEATSDAPGPSCGPY